jgi:Mlc titration factor MtfA (ptsG expression regulator)
MSFGSWVRARLGGGRPAEDAEVDVEPFGDDARAELRAAWPMWNVLTDAERLRVESMAAQLIATRRWEPANGFEITPPMQRLIAAQACLLVLEIGGLDLYRHVSTVLVHPTTVVLEGQRSTGTGGLMSSDPYPILGQAAFDGPTVLAWDAVKFEARHPARGQNVVIHEFAHKLDMLDGLIDGTPPLLEGPARARWVEVCTREYKNLLRGRSTSRVLRDYGAENPGEFFAVATEAFFSVPQRMSAELSDLYEVLRDLYRQDPAARLARTDPHAAAG